MSDRLTLATSTGLPFVSLAFHVAMGVAGLVAGIVALSAAKGSKWHRRAGRVFVLAMIANGLSAIGISLYEGKAVESGAFTVYLILTAFTTVRPSGLGRGVDVALMGLALVFAFTSYMNGFTALGRPGNQLGGVPAGMLFFLASVALLAAIGDFRMISVGGIQGSARIARHLWRMCFGLFIASGSFAAQLVRLTFMPPQFRSMPVILLLGGGPLVVLLYWMWRIRWRRNLRGGTKGLPDLREAGT